MKRFTPFGALLLCGIIGLLTGKFGLWLPLGILAFIVVAVAQSRLAKPGATTAETKDESQA